MTTLSYIKTFYNKKLPINIVQQKSVCQRLNDFCTVITKYQTAGKLVCSKKLSFEVHSAFFKCKGATSANVLVDTFLMLKAQPSRTSFNQLTVIMPGAHN